MRKQFDIKYRPQVESGEYKVETRDGKPARIICWDKKEYKDQREQPTPIVYLITSKGGCEHIMSCTTDGMYSDGLERDSDLFIITPEPEMTVFEKKVYAYCDGKTVGEELIKRIAKELLALARDQFIKDGYILEKKAFHDAVEKVAPEVIKEVSDKVDMEEALRLEYEKGRADVLKEIEQDPESSYYAFKRGLKYGKEEALKDLPRWRKYSDSNNRGYGIRGGLLLNGDWLIELDGLEKLPKEDESHE